MCRYTEADCVQLIRQMLSSVRYLHSKGIIHRDLKLENFLFSDTKSGHSELKLIDFGLSKHFEVGDIHHELVGTRTFDSQIDFCGSSLSHPSQPSQLPQKLPLEKDTTRRLTCFQLEY